MDNIFIADLNNFRIRKVIPIADSVTTLNNFITTDPLQPLIAPGTIVTVAGSGGINFFGDNDLATKAGLPFPTNIAVDNNGNIFIADGSGRIRRVDAPTGIITTSAGNGSLFFSGDNGLAILAGMDAQGVAVDSNGNIFIADTFNNRIRRVDAITNNITTFAGNGNIGAAGDAGPATNASLFSPSSIALDMVGNLFIADTANHRIRRVTPNGIITTVAGNGAAGFSGDNGVAVAASLNNPLGVTIDRAGNMFIADTFNNRIRRVSPNGIITTVAGDGTPLFGGDGNLATRSGLNGPSGVAVDSTGNLLIVDSRNQTIRLVKGIAASQH
jgi:sugar lactone lactonase YvrE